MWLIPLLGLISASALVVYIIASRLLHVQPVWPAELWLEPVLLLGGRAYCSVRALSRGNG